MRQSIALVFTAVILFTAGSNACQANPLSNLLSVFKRDLTVNVTFRDHGNLTPGSDVYRAEDPDGEKVRIGRVEKITVTDQSLFEVQLVIDRNHKERIDQTTRFVLISGFFSESGQSHVVAVSGPGASDAPPLKSGTSVKGYSFLEYKLVVAGKELNRILDSIKTRNTDLMQQLEQYIETLNTEAYQKKLNDLMEDISKFSAEQKKAFENEILPSLRRAVESMIEKLNEQNTPEKSEPLKKQLEEIEKMVVT